MISHARSRTLVLELMLNLRRLGEDHYFSHHRPRVRRHLGEIFAAIAIAHMKGRASTASSLARNLGLPRATIERRVALLLKDGLIERRRNGYCVNEDVVNGPENLALVNRYRHLIMSTAKILATHE